MRCRWRCLVSDVGSMFVRYEHPSFTISNAISLEWHAVQECRYFPRVRDGPHERSRRHPHHLSSVEIRAIICYCAACDEELQCDLSPSLSEYCDCDQYTRWICLPCKTKEDQTDAQYLRACTKGGWDLSHLEEGWNIHDHQWEQAVSERFTFRIVCRSAGTRAERFPFWDPALADEKTTVLVPLRKESPKRWQCPLRLV